MVATAYVFAPYQYHPTPAEKKAQLLAAMRADQRDHALVCVLGILTSRSVAAALPGRQQAALLCATPSNPAQGLGPCLPRRVPGIASGPTQGKAPQTAAARPNGRPAGVPGGFGSRGAASSEAV